MCFCCIWSGLYLYITHWFKRPETCLFFIISPRIRNQLDHMHFLVFALRCVSITMDSFNDEYQVNSNKSVHIRNLCGKECFISCPAAFIIFCISWSAFLVLIYWIFYWDWWHKKGIIIITIIYFALKKCNKPSKIHR